MISLKAECYTCDPNPTRSFERLRASSKDKDLLGALLVVWENDHRGHDTSVSWREEASDGSLELFSYTRNGRDAGGGGRLQGNEGSAGGYGKEALSTTVDPTSSDS